MMLAIRCGCVDVDRVANSLTADQLEEWMAFGIMDGWFDNVWRDVERRSNKLTPQEAKQRLF